MRGDAGIPDSGAVAGARGQGVGREGCAETLASLRAERDKAREECGHEKAMRQSIRDELDHWIRKSMEQDKRIQPLEAALLQIAQYDARWRGQQVNDAPSRTQLVGLAFDTLDESGYYDSSDKGTS